MRPSVKILVVVGSEEVSVVDDGDCISCGGKQIRAENLAPYFHMRPSVKILVVVGSEEVSVVDDGDCISRSLKLVF
jgi:hypothetical protein